MCGKTEMAQCLSKILNIPYFKNKRERKFFEADPGYFVKALKYGDPYFTSYLSQTRASVILDRSFPSEWVYSKVLQRESNEDILRMVDTLYADLNAKIVIPYRSSYKNIQDDSFKKLDSNMLKKIDDEYRKFSKWTSCDTLLLCVDDENLKREMNDIIPFICDIGDEIV